MHPAARIASDRREVAASLNMARAGQILAEQKSRYISQQNARRLHNLRSSCGSRLHSSRRMFLAASAATLFVTKAAADTPFTTFAFPGTARPTSRTTPDRIADIFNVLDFGAEGTGAGSLLSTRYGSLAAAQVDYPFVTSLNDTIDWAATQAAVNAMFASAHKGSTVLVPSGNYVISGTAPPSGLDIGNHNIGANNTCGRIVGTARGSAFITGNIPNGFVCFQDNGVNGLEEISNLSIVNTSTWIGSGGLRLSDSTATFNNVIFGGQIACLFPWNIFNASLNNCTGGAQSDATTGYNGTLGFAGFTPNIKGWRSTNPMMAAIQVSGSNSAHIDGCGIENCVTAILLGTYTGWASSCTVAPDGSNPGSSILTVAGTMGSGNGSGNPGENPEFLQGMTLFGRGLNLPAWGSDPNDSTGGTTITADHNSDPSLTGVGSQGTYRVNGTYTISTAIPIWTRSDGICAGISVSSIQTEACFHSIYVNRVSGCHISGSGFGSNPIECPNQFGVTGLTPRAPFYLKFATATTISGVASAASATTLGGIYVDPNVGQSTSGVTFETCYSQKGADNVATGSISSTVMTITAFTSGVSIGVGMGVFDSGVQVATVTGNHTTDNTLTGVNTTGTYRISPSQTLGSRTLTIKTANDWVPPTNAEAKTGLQFQNCTGNSDGLNNLNRTFASLPGGASSNANVPLTKGAVFDIVDSPTATWGANVTTGGGSNEVTVHYNGTNWTVGAK